jgi:hypothetical protein
MAQYKVGAEVTFLKDVPRTLWPRPGQDNQLLKGTKAIVRRLPTAVPDVAWVSVGDEVDPFGDNWIAVNVKGLAQ